jgi:hypothetical protein
MTLSLTTILRQTPFLIAEAVIRPTERRRIEAMSQRITVTATLMEIKARQGDCRP